MTNGNRAVLCMLKTNVHDHFLWRVRLDELRRLVEALGYDVVGEFVQTRIKPYSKYLIGSGKVKEVREFVDENGVDLVVFYNTLTSSQKLNLTRALGVEVVDRYEVTLRIFERAASDELSKLQIEAARLAKLYPYFKLQASVRFKTERPFMKGMGEYAYHNKVRMLAKRMSRIRERISKLRRRRVSEIERRRRLGYPIVCIAGYYNAGKTSLFNVLTGSDREVSDRPFTTISAKYQRRYLPMGGFMLFVDTIGFVIDLDPELIESFELNLADMKYADVVLFLVDVSDEPNLLSLKLNHGLKLLRRVGVEPSKTLVVFNKVDLVDERHIENVLEKVHATLMGYSWVLVSAKEGINIEGLLEAVWSKILGRSVSISSEQVLQEAP